VARRSPARPRPAGARHPPAILNAAPPPSPTKRCSPPHSTCVARRWARATSPGLLSWWRGRLGAGQGACGSASIRCHAAVIAPAGQHAQGAAGGSGPGRRGRIVVLAPVHKKEKAVARSAARDW